MITVSGVVVLNDLNLLEAISNGLRHDSVELSRRDSKFLSENSGQMRLIRKPHVVGDLREICLRVSQ
jgi:hypothetical protein